MSDDEKLEVTVDSEVVDTHFLFRQKTAKSGKLLEYDYKRCNGCGICVDICPKKAIETGPLIEIATGLDAPPVIIDHTKCSFCGMCAAFCPVRALRMNVDGTDLMEMDDYPHLDSDLTFNDKCLPCLLCVKACPEEAIDVDFRFPEKEKIIPFESGKKGGIEVDMDKCTLCGVCAVFCPAFVPVEKESKADDLIPFSDLLVDLEKCDYCGLCVPLCPEDAIHVKGDFDEGKIRELVPEITGDIKVDDDKCTRCGWCVAVCPYDAVEITKPFEGEIELIDMKLKGCDPVGCHGCFNVCPSKAWIIPKDKKIDVVKEFCTYCGACEKACHVEAIEVKRTSARHTPVAERSWSHEWKEGIRSLTAKERKRPDTTHTVSVEKPEKKIEPPVVKPEINHKYRRAVDERISRISGLLGDKRVRRTWEKKKADTAAAEIRKKIKED